MEAARSMREDFLHQDAFDPVDTYTSSEKMHDMMNLVLEFYDHSLEALNKGAAINDIISLPVREAIGRFKYVEEAKVEETYKNILDRLNKELAEILAKGEDY
jgi:V/A-type H+-transporting ATPase subunit A